jgi:hypothetical protein
MSKAQSTPLLPESFRSGSLLLAAFMAVTQPALAENSTDKEELPVITEETVILSRGSGEVRVADLRARAMEIEPQDRTIFFSSKQRLDTTLRQLVETQQLAAEARRLGLDRSYEFEAAMRLGEARTLAFLYNQHLRKTAVESADLEQIAKEKFMATPPTPSWEIAARHILVRPHGDRNAAAERAEILRRRVAAGESIATLAEKESEDEGSKKNGGLIEGRSEAFSPAFSLAVLGLEKAGDVAPVTETEHGFHVIQLVSKTESGRETFEEKKPQLIGEAEDFVARRGVVSAHERLFGAEIVLNEPAVGWLLANPDAFGSNPPANKPEGER